MHHRQDLPELCQTFVTDLHLTVYDAFHIGGNHLTEKFKTVVQLHMRENIVQLQHIFQRKRAFTGIIHQFHIGHIRQQFHGCNQRIHIHIGNRRKIQLLCIMGNYAAANGDFIFQLGFRKALCKGDKMLDTQIGIIHPNMADVGKVPRIVQQRFRHCGIGYCNRAGLIFNNQTFVQHHIPEDPAVGDHISQHLVVFFRQLCCAQIYFPQIGEISIKICLLLRKRRRR